MPMTRLEPNLRIAIAEELDRPVGPGAAVAAARRAFSRDAVAR
jgi:hypothetical protein